MAAGNVPQEATRIPNLPGLARFLNTWHDWHRGYRIIPNGDGSEEHHELRGQPLHEVEIGHLPRPSPGISRYDSRSRPWVLPNEDDTEPEIQRIDEEELYIPLEDRLFDDVDEGGNTTPDVAVGRALEAPANSALSPPELQELMRISERIVGLSMGFGRVRDRLNLLTGRLNSQAELVNYDWIGRVDTLQDMFSDLVSHINGTVTRQTARLQEVFFVSDQRNLNRPQRSLSARERERQRFTRVFGTVEEVENPDYQSPISSMFQVISVKLLLFGRS